MTVQHTITVHSIDVHNTGKAEITLNSGGSTITIPHCEEKGLVVGVVPHDAEGRWSSLRNKHCGFQEGKIPNWWQNPTES